ncbi:MAG: hypothetical protein KAG53_11145 [Endozoicomonadaceae bacterium]|nr:hypothetical protein [Endozoicomonadaceae bacterium]
MPGTTPEMKKAQTSSHNSSGPNPSDQQETVQHRNSKTSILTKVTSFFSSIKRSISSSITLEERVVSIWNEIKRIGYKFSVGAGIGGQVSLISLVILGGLGIITPITFPILMMMIIPPIIIGAVCGIIYIDDYNNNHCSSPHQSMK